MQQAVFPFLSSMTADSAFGGKISAEHLYSFPNIEENFLYYMQKEASINISPAEKIVPPVVSIEQTILSSFLSENIGNSHIPLAEDTPISKISQPYSIISQDIQLPEALFSNPDILEENHILSPLENKEDLSSPSFPVQKERELLFENTVNSSIPSISVPELSSDLSTEGEIKQDLSSDISLSYFSEDTGFVFSKIGEALPIDGQSVNALSAQEIKNPTYLFVPSRNEDTKNKENLFDYNMFEHNFIHQDASKFDNHLQNISFFEKDETDYQEYLIQAAVPYDKISYTSDRSILESEPLTIPFLNFFIKSSDIISPFSKDTPKAKDIVPVLSLEMAVMDDKSLPILKKITFLADNIKENIPLPSDFIFQKDNFMDYSFVADFAFVIEQKDIILSKDNISPLDIMPQKTTIKEDMPIVSSSFSLYDKITLLPQDDIYLLSKDMMSFLVEEKDVFYEDVSDIKEATEDPVQDKPVPYMLTETRMPAFVPVQADISPKLPVILQSFDKKEGLEHNKSLEHNKADIQDIQSNAMSLPLFSHKEFIPQEEYEFEQSGMIKTDNDSHNIIQEQENLFADEIERGMQAITESATSEPSFVHFKDDDNVSGDENIQKENIPKTDVLKKDIVFMDSKDSFLFKNYDLPSEHILLQDKMTDNENQMNIDNILPYVEDVLLPSRDTIIVQDKNSDGKNHTERESLTINSSLSDSKDVLFLNNDDVTIENNDENKKDKDFSLNNLLPKSENIIATDRIFSISEKTAEHITHSFPVTNISISEPHATEALPIAAQIPLEKNIVLHLTHFKDKPEQIGINLEPAGLGKAELIIENHDNMVTATIRSDKIEVLDLIRKEAPSLEKHLNNSGLNLAGGSLRFEQGGGQGQHHPHSPVPYNIPPSQLPLDNILSQNDISQTLYQKLAGITVHSGMDMRL